MEFCEGFDPERDNPPLKIGDKFQVGVPLTTGSMLWGSIQTAIYFSSEGYPVYRPKWAKVDKITEYWRLPTNKGEEE